MNDSTVLSLNSDCVIQKVDDGAVILRLSDGQIYSCNETTQRFLELTDGKVSFKTITEAFSEEYAIDLATVVADLSSLAKNLLAEDIIDKVN